MAHHNYRKPPAHHFTLKQQERPPGKVGRPNEIRLEHDGVTVTLRELARISGIDYKRLWRRYYQGKRGAELVEPKPKPVPRSDANRYRGLL